MARTVILECTCGYETTTSGGVHTCFMESAHAELCDGEITTRYPDPSDRPGA